MKLVIAEKPSVAQSIAAVLGAKQRRDGFLEGGGYLVSWCYGHLAELADARHYNPDYEKWSLKDLPIIPNPFEFTVQTDKKKQFDLLKNLLKRQDVTEVINACDAGREGELIFRNVYDLSGTSNPIQHLLDRGYHTLYTYQQPTLMLPEFQELLSYKRTYQKHP